MYLGKPVVPALWKLTISDNLPPSNVIAQGKSTVHADVEGAVLQRLLPMIEKGEEKGDEESTSVCDSGSFMALQIKVEIPKPIARDMSSKQKTGSTRWTHWRRKSGGKLGGNGNVRWLRRMTSSWLEPRST